MLRHLERVLKFLLVVGLSVGGLWYAVSNKHRRQPPRGLWLLSGLLSPGLPGRPVVNVNADDVGAEDGFNETQVLFGERPLVI